MKDLLVMVPTRGRKEQCEGLLESFLENTDNADIVFITDGDDQETYEGMDWGPGTQAVIDPRQPVCPKLNATAIACVDEYDAVFAIGDDNRFLTPHWDSILLAELGKLGGTGWIYPDIQPNRRPGFPEIWMMSTDLIRFLGWFAGPTQSHYYTDNITMELGGRLGLLRFCREVAIGHLHYWANPETARDETYSYAETTWGDSDLKAYQEWLAGESSHQISKLRREFSPDVKWLLDKV
jgi:hypothetical protein